MKAMSWAALAAVGLLTADLLPFPVKAPAHAAEPTGTPTATPPTSTEPPPCTLTECIDLALARGAELELREANRDAAIAQRDQAQANYLPKLKLDGGIQVWDSEQVAAFDIGIPGVDIPPFVVRKQVTWSLNITLAQPLSGLWQVSIADALTAMGVDLAELERDAARLDKATTVVEAWLQNVLARELVEVRKTSLAQRSSDRERAGALVRGGVLVEADLLRADLGVMEARQSLSQAERQASLARARLTQLVGEPRTALAAGPTAHGALVGSLAEAKTQALVHRIEVKQVTSKVTQAERAVDLAWSKLVPTVNLVAQAQFSRPSAFSQDAVAFVGVTFDWMAWDWGATSKGIDEARAHVRAARAGLRQLEDGIQLEVESAWVDLAAAEDQQKLAAEAARVAGENYALVQKRFGAKAATSFDLVEAESALTKARLDEKLAHVNGLMARARLARAIGKTATEIAREGTP